jgi:hypothetical protein
VVAAAVENMGVGGSQREDVLTPFLVVQRLLRLAEVVDKETTKVGRAFAGCKHQVSSLDQL